MELRITPKELSWNDSLRELFAYRDLLWVLAYREISVRYKQTAIGILWVVLQPVIATVLFTFIFGHFAKISSDNIPYGLFSFCGMTIWGLFNNAVGRAGLSVIADEKLITKIYFPRAVIPLSSIVSAGFDFLVALVLLLVVACFYGFYPGISLLAIIPAILIAVLASAGLGTALAGWTVRYRDFRYVVPFFLQLGMYASPVVYPTSIIPGYYRIWYYLNPMSGATDLFRYGITGVTPFHFMEILLSAVMAVTLFVAGGSVFRLVERSFADNI
jgi:lipopolysaccharide transport system permease protein